MREKKGGQKIFEIKFLFIKIFSQKEDDDSIEYVCCCGDGDGSPIGEKKHHYYRLLLLLLPRVSNVRGGERQSRRSR